VLVEEGVRFTVLAPHQAARVREAGGEWIDAADALVVGRPYTWSHPGGQGSMAVVFYDGPLSHAVAFELSGLSSQAFVDRLAGARDPAVLAADGESFGHHHKFTERLLAHALTVEAGRRDIEIVSVAEIVRTEAPVGEVEVAVSSWSCAHGVERWRSDCGCHTGGGPGWNQAWRAPLPAAPDGVRAVADEGVERRGQKGKAAGRGRG
jgi:hypothetical protein